MIVDNLEQIRHLQKLTIVEFVNKLGITPQAYNNYKNGRTVPTEVIYKTQRLFSISVDWLFTGEGVMYRNKNASMSVTTEPDLIPLVHCGSGSAGTGILIQDTDQHGFVYFDTAFLKKLAVTSAKNLKVLEVDGVSMEPTLHDRELIIIDTGVTSYAGIGVYVVRYESEIFIKRIQKTKECYHIVSDNKVYPEIVATDVNDFQILAKFVIGFKYI